MAVERFAGYLDRLLKERDMTAADLARAIEAEGGNCHPDSIRKWLREDGTPKLDSDYTKRIAQALQLTPVEHNLLKQAQIISLTKPNPKVTSDAEEELEELSIFQLRPQGEVYEGRRMLEKACELLEALPAPPAKPSDATILLTFEGQDMFESVPDLHERWHTARYEALKKGWLCCHVWRFDSTPHRTPHFVEANLQAISTGHYLPRYFEPDTGLLPPPINLLVLPQRAAMIFFATENPTRTDAAVLFTDAPLVRLLQGYFRQLAGQATPLMKQFLLNQPQEKKDFWNALEEAEERRGDRLLVKRSGLSTLSRSLDWYKEGYPFAQEAQRAGIDYDWVLKHYARRWKAFEQKIRTEKYQEVCPRQAIEALVKTCRYPRDNVLGIEYQATPAEVRAHLRHVMTMLDTYDNYALALADRDEGEKIFDGPFWEIIGEESVLLQTWTTEKAGQGLDLGFEITQAEMIQAFHAYFRQLWERIDRHHKKKDWVIGWLGRQIEELSS